MPRLTHDMRASATGISNFFLALLVGAIMSFLVSTIAEPLFDHVGDRTAATDEVGPQATIWLETVVTHQPTLFLIIAFFSLLALAVFQRVMSGR